MPRSNQTKHLLAQSLQELMATTPLEKISVNDIVDHANVGRNTFYYHFEDKYDLVNWYFQSGITRFLVELSAYSSWNALLAALEDTERQIVALHALSGLKHREIAAMLERPLSTVLSRYHRALGKLRNALAEEEV